ncbi:MAG: tRNA (guanine(10)-N(2))-dimethyltransferase [Candidatus Bathyarchaeota archaeon]|nr:tRNA (guanine(10)-N(2))-dimethyltransferase [Candidatus Bathyarchaeota archaeon]
MSGEFKIDFPVETITEGKVEIVVPKLEFYGVTPSDYAPSRAPVFYNPIMEFNRDLTILAFQAYQRTVGRDIVICEPLTGTGIRGIRFAVEIEGVKAVVSGDINQRSAKLAEYNVGLNGVQKMVSVRQGDANRILSDYSAPYKRFEIVDIDPFGTPVPYLDTAIRALRNKGLLAVTATDMAPLCGVHPKACIRKYGGKPIRAEYCHELAIRLLVACIASVAAKHEIGIQPMFSHCSDHYIRVYVEISYGAQKADESLRNVGYILHCFGCLHRETTQKPFGKTLQCPHCGAKMEFAGPLWLGKIFDAKFCGDIQKENMHRPFKNHAKITKLLSLIQEEAEAPITYYVLDRVSQSLGLPVPPLVPFLQALRDKGYLATHTHFNPRGIRTNAPAKDVQAVLRKMLESQ